MISRRRIGISTSMAALLFACVTTTFAARIDVSEGRYFDVGLRLQSWATFIDEDVIGGDRDNFRFDASLRRAYIYFGGQAHPKFQYMAILAGDRIGQAGFDAPAAGVGSAFALRGAWVTANLADEFKIQMGRMYVPFTRGFGTQAAFAVQPLDLSPFQAGAMIPGRRAARDEGVVFWGNIDGGTVQYRLGVMDGSGSVSGSARVAGRVVANLITPEPNWFTGGARLKGDGIVSLGVGFDMLPEFFTDENGAVHDHAGFVGDAYFSLPVGERFRVIGEGTVGVIDQDDAAWTGTYLFGTVGALLDAGDLPTGPIHPYFRYERFDAAEGIANPPAPETELSVGAHFYPDKLDHAFKTTLDWTNVKPREAASHNRITSMMQVSF